MVIKKTALLLALSLSSTSFAKDIEKSFDIDVNEVRTKIKVGSLIKNKDDLYIFTFHFKGEKGSDDTMYFFPRPMYNNLNSGWDYGENNCSTLWQYKPVENCVLELIYDPDEAATSDNHMLTLTYSHQYKDGKHGTFAEKNRIVIYY